MSGITGNTFVHGKALDTAINELHLLFVTLEEKVNELSGTSSVDLNAEARNALITSAKAALQATLDAEDNTVKARQDAEARLNELEKANDEANSSSDKPKPVETPTDKPTDKPVDNVPDSAPTPNSVPNPADVTTPPSTSPFTNAPSEIEVSTGTSAGI